MSILDEMILPKEVVVVPVTELPADVRQRIGCSDESFAIGRTRFRASSKIIDSETAELLRQFEQPRRIVDAVMRFSRDRGLDPEMTLEGIYPVLQTLFKARLLVRLGSEEESAILPSLEPGDEFEGLVIYRAIQVLEDTVSLRTLSEVLGGDPGHVDR